MLIQIQIYLIKENVEEEEDENEDEEEYINEGMKSEDYFNIKISRKELYEKYKNPIIKKKEWTQIMKMIIQIKREYYYYLNLGLIQLLGKTKLLMR